jgi:hypothetical protein
MFILQEYNVSQSFRSFKEVKGKNYLGEEKVDLSKKRQGAR